MCAKKLSIRYVLSIFESKHTFIFLKAMSIKRKIDRTYDYI